MKKTILIIDDDVQIGNMEQELLEQAGYDCLRAYSGTEALLILKENRPDLIILDLMLPGLSGEEVLSQIRGIPVIVVSAKVGIEDKIALLLGGAADYLTKPFHTGELLARIEVQLRRQSFEEEKILRHADLKLDLLTHQVEIQNQCISLTRTEYALLKLLMQHGTQVMPKSLILEAISEDTPDCTESSLKTHISHLRTKLREAGGKEYIESVWGIGFKMIEE